MSNETPAEVLAVHELPAMFRRAARHMIEAQAIAYEYCADQLERSLAAGKVAPDGYVLVPRKPTKGMIDAGAIVICRGQGEDYTDDAVETWAKMIETAPPADPAKASEPDDFLLRAAREVLSTELGEMACIESHAPAENALGLLSLAVAQYPEGPAKASGSAQSEGCAVCFADCAGANPPVMNCPMRGAEADATPPASAPEVTESMVERLAKHIAREESQRCNTLDEALNHQAKWQRIVPEARAMLTAALQQEGKSHG